MKQGRTVILYNSALLVILAGISAWLSAVKADPTQINPGELVRISGQLQEISMSLKSDEVAKSTNINTVMAWWYPGAPACSAVAEAMTHKPDVIKPEYFIVGEGGGLSLMTEADYGCNGYSRANIEKAKAISPTRFVTVSSSYAHDMDAFLQRDAITNESVRTLVDFVLDNEFTGVELDFEDYGGWTTASYARYQSFISRLGAELHRRDKELMLTLPPTSDTVEESWYVFRLSDFERLPVDYLVIMAYDYQYDHGPGQPIAPLVWLKEVATFTKSRVSDDSKIVMGLPTYGYVFNHATGDFQLLTKDQAAKYAIYNQAKRDPSSQELMAKGGKQTLVYQDEISIQAKIDTVELAGISHVSLWHLGGNPWFTQ